MERAISLELAHLISISPPQRSQACLSVMSSHSHPLSHVQVTSTTRVFSSSFTTMSMRPTILFDFMTGMITSSSVSGNSHMTHQSEEVLMCPPSLSPFHLSPTRSISSNASHWRVPLTQLMCCSICLLCTFPDWSQATLSPSCTAYARRICASILTPQGLTLCAPHLVLVPVPQVELRGTARSRRTLRA